MDFLNKFVNEIVDFRKLKFLELLDLEICVREFHQILGACQVCSERLHETFWGLEIHYSVFRSLGKRNISGNVQKSDPPGQILRYSVK